MLYRLGLALELLDLGVGHTVLDFGAGCCWLSVALNRLGCRTVSVDVSRAALAIGAQALERDPNVRGELEPRLVPYDGRVLPLGDASIDRAICFDAFHHVPNPDEVLAELFRVLRPGGRLVLAEPGAGHAHSDAALFEMARFGVLENELVLEDLLADARRAGFDRFEVKPYPDVDNLTLPAEAHLRLLGGDHSVYPLDQVIAGLRELHLVAMLKAGSSRDSRNPGTLKARIDLGSVTRVEGDAGKEVTVQVRITNTGDTLWLAAEDSVLGGYVCLGGHLHDRSGVLMRANHFTERLPNDVPPGATVSVDARIGLPEASGHFRLRLDMVDDRVAWFSQVGSPTVDLELVVDWSDSRDPHRFEARIEAAEPLPPRAVNGAFSLKLRVTNAGDTRWLHGASDDRGTVRVGVQALHPDGTIADRDYFRAPLPCAVSPGETVEVSATVPLRSGVGRSFAIDLVAEHICWFDQHGSRPLTFTLLA